MIPQELIDSTKKWLGQEGINFFREVKEKHGKVNAVYMDEWLIHPVHFREGMQVRNHIRSTGLCPNWNDFDLDEKWVEVIEECIRGITMFKTIIDLFSKSTKCEYTKTNCEFWDETKCKRDLCIHMEPIHEGWMV